MSRTFCTVIAKNYLAYARVLNDSVNQYYPDASFEVLVIDRPEGCFAASQEKFPITFLEELGIPSLDRFTGQYLLVELATAAKYYFLAHLFAQRPDVQQVIYLDPDILLLDRLPAIDRALAAHEIVLTPHLRAPTEESERPFLRYGAYNLGFLGLRRGTASAQFLDWAKRRLYDECRAEIAQNLFVDQRWMDLAPALFDQVGIVREAGYNVAHWNLAQHPRETWKFFHFSAFSFEDGKKLSRHEKVSVTPAALALAHHYRELLERAGHRESRHYPYSYRTQIAPKLIEKIIRYDG